MAAVRHVEESHARRVGATVDSRESFSPACPCEVNGAKKSINHGRNIATGWPLNGCKCALSQSPMKLGLFDDSAARVGQRIRLPMCIEKAVESWNEAFGLRPVDSLAVCRDDREAESEGGEDGEPQSTWVNQEIRAQGPRRQTRLIKDSASKMHAVLKLPCTHILLKALSAGSFADEGKPRLRMFASNSSQRIDRHFRQLLGFKTTDE